MNKIHATSARESGAARRQPRGFSIVELLVVVSILVVVAVMAIPTIVTSVADVRLRSGMSSLSGLIQNSRMTAIKLNKTRSVHFSTMSYGPVAYVKDAGDTSALTSADLQAQLGAPVTKITTPSGAGAPTELDGETLWGTSTEPLTEDPSFNARGMPCHYDSSNGKCSTNMGYVFYFTDTRPLGKNGWGAVSISPAGRVKAWLWDGNNWN